MKLKHIPVSIASLAVAYVMYGAMKNHRPPEDAHHQAVTAVVERMMDKIFTEKIKIPESSKKMADYISNTLVPEVTQQISNQQIDVTNLNILNLGSITSEDGEQHLISLGIFDNIFTMNEEEIYKIVIEKVKSSEELQDLFIIDNEENLGE